VSVDLCENFDELKIDFIFGEEQCIISRVNDDNNVKWWVYVDFLRLLLANII